ncbi:MAG: RhuM family protein [Anaerorhabdus sp.]|uniref:RhuM family protein n=1 Tax=Anaerorhabdus sp. TaxID=1872524 RepID=UPI002FC6D21C
MEQNNIVSFEDGEIKLEVSLSLIEETVWLTSNDLSNLFEKDVKTINEHINNIFKEGELDEKTSTGISSRSSGGRKPKVFNLDVAVSVGYRVKSKRGILFRQWATRVLKEYTLKGVVNNDKRLKQLERMQEIQVDMMEEVICLVKKEVNLFNQVSIKSIKVLEGLIFIQH